MAINAQDLNSGDENRGLDPYDIEDSSDQEYEDDGYSDIEPSHGGNFCDDPPIDQPLYEDGRLQMFNDVAKDESFASFLAFVKNSALSEAVKGRLIAQAAAVLSKNYVFSVLSDERDLLMAQDDIEMIDMMSEVAMTRYDKNADYLTAKAILSSNTNIRIRRSKGGLFLKQLNTTRSESVSEERMQAESEKKNFRQKIPIIGSFL